MVIGERLAHTSCLYEINDPLTHWRIAIYFCSAIHQNITRCCSANGLKCQKPWSVAISVIVLPSPLLRRIEFRAALSRIRGRYVAGPIPTVCWNARFNVRRDTPTAAHKSPTANPLFGESQTDCSAFRMLAELTFVDHARTAELPFCLNRPNLAFRAPSDATCYRASVFTTATRTNYLHDNDVDVP